MINYRQSTKNMASLSYTLENFGQHVPPEYELRFRQNKKNLFRGRPGFVAMPFMKRGQKNLPNLQANGLFEARKALNLEK